MPFEFRPRLRRRSRKPVPAAINDIHIPPGDSRVVGAADDFKNIGIKGLRRLFAREQKSEITIALCVIPGTKVGP